jgi:hypothetical protein
MRHAIARLATVTAVLITDARSGSAQESFFNERYCSQTTGSGPGTGIPNCSFHTWQQCIESARGLGRYCTENSFWRGPREQPTTQGRSRKRNR